MWTSRFQLYAAMRTTENLENPSDFPLMQSNAEAKTHVWALGRVKDQALRFLLIPLRKDRMVAKSLQVALGPSLRRAVA